MKITRVNTHVKTLLSCRTIYLFLLFVFHPSAEWWRRSAAVAVAPRLCTGVSIKKLKKKLSHTYTVICCCVYAYRDGYYLCVRVWYTFYTYTVGTTRNTRQSQAIAFTVDARTTVVRHKCDSQQIIVLCSSISDNVTVRSTATGFYPDGTPTIAYVASWITGTCSADIPPQLF